MASDFELQFHAVVGEADVGRERGISRFVRQVMADVGEEDSPGAQFIGNADRVFDGGVCGVGPVAQTVEEKDVEVLQESVGGAGD